MKSDIENRIRNIITLIGIILLLIQSNFVNAQEISRTYLQVQYTVRDGLPSGETYDVFQDSKGFIWIGTDKGVSKFDGSQFINFTTNDGLTDNTVFRFFEDSSNRIWCITYNRKLCYFKEGEIFQYQYNDKIVDHLSDFYVGITINHFKHLSNGTIELMLSNFEGFQIDSNGVISEMNIPFQSPAKELFSKTGDGEDVLQEVYEFMTAHFSEGKLSARNRDALTLNYQIFKGHLIQFSKNGAIYYNPTTKSIDKRILQGHYLSGMTEDFEGGLWFSTLNSGIIYLPNPNLEFYSTTKKLSNNYLQAIFPQDSSVVFKFNPSTNFCLDELNHILKPCQKQESIYRLPEFNRYQGMKFENAIQIYPIRFKTKTLLQINDSTILHSSTPPKSLVVSKILKNQSLFSHYVNGPSINKILKYTNQSIWIGASSGVFKLDEDTIIPAYPENHILSNLSIQDMAVIGDSILVFATRVNGLFYSFGDTIFSFTESQGLISNTVNQIQFDKRTKLLWVASPKGICSISTSKQGLISVNHVLNSTSGLVSTDIRQFYVNKDYLYFGTNSGISRIATKHLDDYIPPPRLFVNSVKVNGANKSLPELQKLKYFENELIFEFSAISFNSFSDVKYEHFVEGLHSKPIRSSNPILSLYGLEPGEYTLRTKAFNSNNSASRSIQVPFVIVPAFWMTWWFKFFMGVTIFFIVFVISQYIIFRIKTRATLQIDNQRLTSMNLQSKMNPHFIFNSLNSIQHYIMSNKPILANDYLIDFSTLIRQVLNNSNSPEIVLSEELTTLQLYADLEKRRLNDGFEFNLEIDPKIKTDLCTVPALLLQPFIENSIWHGKLNVTSNAIIILRINLKSDTLYFEIEDNGIGYFNSIKGKKEKSGRKYGTKIAEERIKLISRLNKQLSEVVISNSKNLDCESPNVGTLVSFSVPYILKKE